MDHSLDRPPPVAKKAVGNENWNTEKQIPSDITSSIRISQDKDNFLEEVSHLCYSAPGKKGRSGTGEINLEADSTKHVHVSDSTARPLLVHG